MILIERDVELMIEDRFNQSRKEICLALGSSVKLFYLCLEKKFFLKVKEVITFTTENITEAVNEFNKENLK